jgi:hypothetical protein
MENTGPKGCYAAEMGDSLDRNGDVAIASPTSWRKGAVKKHVQNVFQKLGVENRTAAALVALEVLGLPDGNS